MKSQYFITKEEEDLEKLLHCIHTIFSVYTLFNHATYPGLTSARSSIYANRKPAPLSERWLVFNTKEKVDEENRVVDWTEEQTPIDETPISLHQYYKILLYLYVFRERPIGHQFAPLFNVLFCPLFEEFYIATYLIGSYYREKPCYTLERIESILTLVWVSFSSDVDYTSSLLVWGNHIPPEQSCAV